MCTSMSHMHLHILVTSPLHFYLRKGIVLGIEQETEGSLKVASTEDKTEEEIILPCIYGGVSI